MPTLQFKGKNIIWNHHLSVPYHTLEEVEDLHFQPEKGNGNLIIEGDNLIALKALLPEYAGKVKCIYIDPPYNTGNEGWVYNDKVNSPLINNWLGKTVGTDDLTRHDKWLCMMTPRLKILRDLLSDDGAIFISIDDNEIHHLRQLCDEIFGNNNTEEMIWKKVENDSGKLKITHRFRIEHEYVLVCYKVKENVFFKKYLSERNYKNTYTNPDNDPRGEYKQGIISTTEEKSKINGKNYYSITTPGGNIITRQWRFDKDEYEKYDKDNRIYYGKTGNSIPALKVFINELGETTPMSILEGFGTAKTAGMNLLELFNNERIFDYPKPVPLLKNILEISTNKDSIILDSFAGSGTTMQAVNELNKEDGGNRKCILVQMKEDSEAEPDKNICHQITRERNKLAIEKLGYESGFKYLKVGTAIDPEQLLEGNLPTYEQFAKYIYYLGTGEHLAEAQNINAENHFVGTHGAKSFFLIYEQDVETLTRLALNLSIAEDIVKHSPNKRRVIYAPACFLDSDYMEEKQIEFVSIPYNLFERQTN